MGKRDRERIERILSGEERPIADKNCTEEISRSGISGKVINRVESLARKVVEKTAAAKWIGMSLPQQVAVTTKMLRVSGVANFRADFLKPTGFPSDIEDKYKNGWTNERIREYYLGCPEFVGFWKKLELDETHFEELLREGAAKHLGA
jgi:hypothetical protein